MLDTTACRKDIHRFPHMDTYFIRRVNRYLHVEKSESEFPKVGSLFLNLDFRRCAISESTFPNMGYF